MDINLTPFPFHVHIVYGWPLVKFSKSYEIIGYIFPHLPLLSFLT